MSVTSDAKIVSKLEEIMESSSSQSDKTAASLEILRSAATQSPRSLISFTNHLCTSSSVPVVVGRTALAAVVTILCAGSGYDPSQLLASSSSSSNAPSPSPTPQQPSSDDEWYQLGLRLFSRNTELDQNQNQNHEQEQSQQERLEIVQSILSDVGHVTWCEEHVSTLKRLLAFLLEQDEEWTEAAKVLMSIPLESTGRIIPEEEKLKVYIQIVRLLLETGESGQAQTYFTRASLLIHHTKSKEIQLSYRLCQARLFDFSRRFNEAAGRYHELSFVQDIDEEERIYMLGAAVTCAILGPAGPQRSRILANLYRDERTVTSLPAYKSAILGRMFFDHILRMDEVREFEKKDLSEHHKAKLAVDRRTMAVTEEEEADAMGRKGAENILDRAVMEHNVLACAKVYDNIHFAGLGELLDLTPSAAEAMARTMIEQRRLRAWIDQVDRLIYFEGRSAKDDSDVQGTAGGLGVAQVDRPIEPISLTERWDERIKQTATKVEDIVNMIQAKGLMTAN